MGENSGAAEPESALLHCGGRKSAGNIRGEQHRANGRDVAARGVAFTKKEGKNQLHKNPPTAAKGVGRKGNEGAQDHWKKSLNRKILSAHKIKEPTLKEPLEKGYEVDSIGRKRKRVHKVGTDTHGLDAHSPVTKCRF